MKRSKQERRRLGSLIAAFAGIFQGTAASQLWQHHTAGWYWFAASVVLLLIWSLL